MRNFTDFALRLEYERVKDLGDKLVTTGITMAHLLEIRCLELELKYYNS
ncbi:MAG: hypothetical protein IPI63_09765 [Methanothrix sp.]|jgi:hypothetical protein|nr:hypothetical protein [Methanothrix sp.]MBK7386974.1 hypothetical protein [Methanothrix sp.]